MTQDHSINPEKMPELITDYLAGELSDETRAQVEELIANSEEFKREFESQKQAWDLAIRALALDQIPDSLRPEQYRKIFGAEDGGDASDDSEDGTTMAKDDSKLFPPPSESKWKKIFASVKQSTVSFKWMEIAASVVFLLACFALLLPMARKSREKARRISCASDLKQVGVSLEQYQKKHNVKPQATPKDKGMVLYDIVDDSLAAAGTDEAASEDFEAVVTEVEMGGGREPGKSLSKPVPTAPAIASPIGDYRKMKREVVGQEKLARISWERKRQERKPANRFDAFGAAPESRSRAGEGLAGAMTTTSGASSEGKKTRVAEVAWRYGANVGEDKNAANEPREEIAEAEEGVGDVSVNVEMPEFKDGLICSDIKIQEPRPELRTVMKKARTQVERDRREKLSELQTVDYDKSDEVEKEAGFLSNEVDEVKSLPDTTKVASEITVVSNEMEKYTSNAPFSGKLGEGQVNKRKILGKTTKPLKKATFSINLKLWDMTTPENAKAFLVDKGVKAQADELFVFVRKNDGKLTVLATDAVLKQVEGVMNGLIAAEDELREAKDGLPFIDTKLKPISTFSIDVDTASYTASRKVLKAGGKPVPTSVRPEEFINYFDYHYRSPENAMFAVYLEAAPSPFRSTRYVLRVGVQGKRLGPDAERASVFTVLVDTSGSMAAKNRLDLTRQSIGLLLDQMKPNDRISVLTCEENIGVVVDNVSADRRDVIEAAVDGIETGGFANIEKGLVAAYDFALKRYRPGGNNRVIVFSDGIVEIDSATAEEVVAKVEKGRRQGIGNTIIGLGGDGDDQLMETLANKGDGMYVFLDGETEARELFTEQFAAKFREIARDVKIQVEFNPELVAKYRQIGYQNRQLSKADFRNDSVDAGEVGSGQSVTALYEWEPLSVLRVGTGADEDARIVATARLRYRRVDTAEVEEREFYLTEADLKPNYESSTANFKLALVAGEFAESLRYPSTPGVANPRTLLDQLRPLLGGVYANDAKVRELFELINLCR